jgi:hypothetical protein
MFISDTFSSPKGNPKEDNEVITISMPLKWNERGLKDSNGVIFQIPPIPSNGSEQIEFSCLVTKMVSTRAKQQTLVGVMNAKTYLGTDHKTLSQVQFHTDGEDNKDCKSDSDSDMSTRGLPPIESSV